MVWWCFKSESQTYEHLPTYEEVIKPVAMQLPREIKKLKEVSTQTDMDINEKRLKIIKLENFFKTRFPPRVRTSKKYTLENLDELLNTIEKRTDKYQAICELYDTLLEFSIEKQYPNILRAMIEKADDFIKDDALTSEQKEQFEKYKKQIKAIEKMKKN